MFVLCFIIVFKKLFLREINICERGLMGKFKDCDKDYWCVYYYIYIINFKIMINLNLIFKGYWFVIRIIIVFCIVFNGLNKYNDFFLLNLNMYCLLSWEVMIINVWKRNRFYKFRY